MIHRDDLDYEDAERLIAELKEANPGHEIVFAGDAEAEMDEETRRQMQEILLDVERRLIASVIVGCCWHCGDGIQEYPDVVGNSREGSGIKETLEGYEPPVGWEQEEVIGCGKPMYGWVCPLCVDEEEEEP